MTAQSTLKNRWILDSGSDIHVTNNLNCLQGATQPCGTRRVIAGATTYNVEAVGNVTLVVKAPQGHKATMTVTDVVYIHDFMSNIVSLTRLMTHQIHWNTEQSYLTRNG